jgi:glycosyltransferase involved in cell wall biosynthesis
MDRMLITISEKSEDGSLEAIRKFEKDYPQKVRIYFENVSKPSELTTARQRMVDDTYEDWILFLDDDDMWYKESLDEMVKLIEEDVDGYAVSPIQVVDQFYYDKFWYDKKFFTKLFRNDDIRYVEPWPRDLITSGDKALYWKKNERVKRLVGKYFHLSNIKPHSFRKEKWAKDKFLEEVVKKEKYPNWCKKYIEIIYGQSRTHK